MDTLTSILAGVQVSRETFSDRPIQGTFAPVTETLQSALRALPRCASELYFWLRRLGKPGSPIEFNLEEFATYCGYSLRWANKCLRTLIESELVAQDRQAWGYWFRVILSDPGYKKIDNKNDTDRPFNDTDRNWSDKKQPSNPHDLVADQKEIFKSTEDRKPTHHPVENNRKSDRPSVQEAHPNATDPLYQKVLGEVEQAISPQPINPQIKRTVLDASLEILHNAIAQLRQQKEQGKVKNPAGFLIAAIRGRWKPKIKKSQQAQAIDPPPSAPPPLPDGFKDWFDLALQVGVVRASMQRTDDIWVLCGDDEWEPWRLMAAAFPIDQLQQLRDLQKQIPR